LNYNAAKAMLPLLEDLWEYFGLGRHGGSHYKHKRPFCPGNGPLSITAPRQLHYTGRQDGVYIQMSGGVPELKHEIVAMLDGVPYQVMREAVESVRYHDEDACRSLELTSDRSAFTSKTQISRQQILSRKALDERLVKACRIILEHLDWWLAKQVEERAHMN